MTKSYGRTLVHKKCKNSGQKLGEFPKAHLLRMIMLEFSQKSELLSKVLLFLTQFINMLKQFLSSDT